jgi:hypothetical protein
MHGFQNAKLTQAAKQVTSMFEKNAQDVIT